MTNLPPAIVWFRSDLRLSDNEALTRAAANGRPVLPLYILDDDSPGQWALGGASRWWLHHSLVSLAASLERTGATLMLSRGDATKILPALMDEIGAAELHAGRSHEPWARAVEAALTESLGDRLILHRTTTLFDLDAIRTGGGTAYGVYSPFAKACRARGSDVGDPLPAPQRLTAVQSPRSDRLEDWALLPTKPDWAGGLRDKWQVGEAAAQTRLREFLAATVAKYKTGRNLPGEDGTSRLSAHLHWGEISARQVWHGARPLPPGGDLDTYTGEILWREFSAYLLWHHPTLPQTPLRPAFDKLPFRTDPAELAAWQRGQTGIPIVDAGDTPALAYRLDAQPRPHGGRLVSGQAAADRLARGPALVLGHPRRRRPRQQCRQLAVGRRLRHRQPALLPHLQPGEPRRTWDKAGAYVRQWVPELAKLPEKYLHAPWTAPQDALTKAGVTLGTSYPTRSSISPRPATAPWTPTGPPCAEPPPRARPKLDPGRRDLRIVGDVHGDLRAFSAAASTDRFLIQLGDLSDHGPDSAGVLRRMFELIDTGRGLFILGNHDRKLGRFLAGYAVRSDAALEATVEQLDPALRERALHEINRAPAWLIRGGAAFVHGGFHPAMLHEKPPPPLGRVDPLLSRALFGETTGRMQSDGYPERRRPLGRTASPPASPSIVATTSAAPTVALTSAPAPPAAEPSSSTPGPARAATSPGSISPPNPDPAPELTPDRKIPNPRFPMSENPVDPSPAYKQHVATLAKQLFEADGSPEGRMPEYEERADELARMEMAGPAGLQNVEDSKAVVVEEASIQKNLGEFPPARWATKAASSKPQ